jgi:hypothetical protein
VGKEKKEQKIKRVMDLFAVFHSSPTGATANVHHKTAKIT